MARAVNFFKFLLLLSFIIIIIGVAIYSAMYFNSKVVPDTIIIPTPETISIMSYNIHYGEIRDGSYNLDKIINVIKEKSPDFICLNNVDNKAVRTYRDDQARKIAAVLGMKFTFARNVKLEGGWNGNAILSKYPIKYAENKFLITSENDEPKSLLHAILKAGEIDIHIYSTELSKDSIQAEKQVKEIIEFSTKKGVEKPIIIAGDFHLTSENQHIEELEYYFQSGSDKFINEQYLTYPANNPTKQYDYIFYNKNLILLNTEVINNESVQNTSDHLPIIARFRIK